MEFIDTHCHIYDEAFDPDFVQTVDRARDAGIVQFILPAINIDSYDRMIAAEKALDGTGFSCIGLHPTEVGATWENEMAFVREKLKQRKFQAIGEIGLDKHWSVEFLKEQKRVFADQITIAAEYDLPIIIHVREAADEIFEILEETRGVPVRGVFHAYSGSYETYCRCLKYGDFKFGIGGVVTYKKSGIAEILHKLSLEDLLLETDCPYLTPVPHRGERNESAYVRIIAEKISALIQTPLEEVAEKTTNNARKLFNI